MKDKKQMQNDLPKLTDTISIHYKKFFSTFAEIETLEINKWKISHLLGYFCKRYEQYYNGLKYSFKFNHTAPSKSYEVFQMNKLANMLSSNPEILKEYIDWVFDKKIIERKKKLTSIGYLTTTDIVNEYKFKYLLTKQNNPIDRSTSLSDNIIYFANDLGIQIKTYGDLAFIKQIAYSPNAEEKYIKLIDYIKTLQFDFTILDKIK